MNSIVYLLLHNWPGLVLGFGLFVEIYELLDVYFFSGMEAAMKRFYVNFPPIGDMKPRQEFILHLFITWFMALFFMACLIYWIIKNYCI
jgi:hypothetical protein